MTRVLFIGGSNDGMWKQFKTLPKVLNIQGEAHDQRPFVLSETHVVPVYALSSMSNEQVMERLLMNYRP